VKRVQDYLKINIKLNSLREEREKKRNERGREFLKELAHHHHHHHHHHSLSLK